MITSPGRGKLESHVDMKSPEGAENLILIQAFRRLHPDYRKKEIIDKIQEQIALNGEKLSRQAISAPLNTDASGYDQMSRYFFDSAIVRAYQGMIAEELAQDSDTKETDILAYAQSIIDKPVEVKKEKVPDKNLVAIDEIIKESLPEYVDGTIIDTLVSEFKINGNPASYAAFQRKSAIILTTAHSVNGNSVPMISRKDLIESAKFFNHLNGLSVTDLTVKDDIVSLLHNFVVPVKGPEPGVSYTLPDPYLR
ncbi:MAG: hypothetical protein GY861_06400 [bacterium]|nr:hypothetical protein [bacterium]